MSRPASHHLGLLPALVLTLAGCTVAGEAVTERTETFVNGPEEGGTYPRGIPIALGAQGFLLRAGELSFVTWPEGEPVPGISFTVAIDASATPGCESDPHDGCSSYAESPWPEVEADRWYALVWTPDPSREVVVERVYDGVPIAGGSFVWRVYRGSVPQVDWIQLTDAGVSVSISEGVRLREGVTLADPLLTVVQRGATCALVPPVERGSFLESRCSSFDPLAPTTVRVEDGWESLEAVPLPTVAASLDYAPGDVPVLRFERALQPPGVPAELCAGVECAE